MCLIQITPPNRDCHGTGGDDRRRLDEQTKSGNDYDDEQDDYDEQDIVAPDVLMIGVAMA